MSDLLLNTIIDRLNSQAQTIDRLKENVENLPDKFEKLNDIARQTNSIQDNIQKISFPEKELRQLSLSLNQAITIFQRPQKNEVVNHHHVPKLIWITAGLFIVLCLVCSGWYMTSDKLENFVANDTKYRYLKLNSNPALQKLLSITDSMYHLIPGMRDSVVAIEEEKMQSMELQKQAEEKEKEADALRYKANHPKK
jgi:hypothetical protein